MPEIGTSGLMSGVGKRGGARRQYLRPTSTLPANLRVGRRKRLMPHSFSKGRLADQAQTRHHKLNVQTKYLTIFMHSSILILDMTTQTPSPSSRPPLVF